MNLNKKLVQGLFVAAVIGATTIGGTMAYLTDSENVVNEFTVGNVDIDVEENAWIEENGKNIEPMKVIPKDPKIINVGKNAAYAFLEVSIPVKNVITANEAGEMLPAADLELFTFEATEKWTLIKKEQVEGYQVYTYAYNEVLAPQTTSTALFNEVTFINVVSGALDNENLNIPVKGYAIQTTSTGGDGATVVDQAKIAFTKIVK